MSDETITYDIDDPDQARMYVRTFAPRLLGKKATYVKTNKRVIDFANMSDEDACMIARQFWGWESGK
jgi:hypothetical protein